MSNKWIATTDRSGLSLAQVGGNDVYKMLPQLQDVINMGRLGNDYVTLFAEPVDNGRSIDWYVEAGDKVVPINDLDPEEKKSLLQNFGKMLDSLRNYATELRQNQSQASRNYGDIIDKALIVPDLENSLYSADGRPVLVNWGFSSGDFDVVDGTQKLLKEIQDKMDDIQNAIEKAQDAPPPAPEPSPEPEPGPEPEPPVQEMGPQPAPSQPPASQNPPIPPAKGGSSALIAVLVGAGVLLAGAAAMWYFLTHKDNDANKEKETPKMEWLKGDLNAKGVLINENNEAVDLRLHFEGEDGKGKSYIVEKNQTCEGDVTASPITDNRVSFAIDHLICPNKNNYEPFTMTCVRGQNTCEGKNRNGETWNLQVTIQ